MIQTEKRLMNLRWRYVWPLIFTSFSLVTLCVFSAISLFREHAAIAGTMRENVASRRAATDLEECLHDINVLLQARVESVESLHHRTLNHLERIDALADQAEEKALASRLHQSFRSYLEFWKQMPPPDQDGHEAAVKQAVRLLESSTLKICEELMQFNAVRIENSTEYHEQALRQLAWGIAGVSGLGGVAGLFLGYGLARGLSQSIQKLRVQIQDAAGRLGGELPAIVLSGHGDLVELHSQMDHLSARIGAILQQLRERELEVLRAEQLAAVGQLATGVAHEIRNPLTSIKMLVQAGLEDKGVALANEDLRIIEQEIRRMERSLKTFLDFARPPKLERRQVDILPLICDVLGLTRGRMEKQGVQVEYDAPTEAIPLVVDGERLQQVLVNLILNALDAMPAGGTLTLKVHPRSTGGAIIRIADTGGGIAQELMPKLFQPFVSGKETGLGMGLVVSRRIIENHGGTINVANNSNKGAEFTICLPGDCLQPAEAVTNADIARGR
jgi:two-component system sensor histidine kinase HydH